MNDCLKKILVIDDDPDLHRLLRPALEEAGFQYLFAMNARQGKDLAEKHSPALLIIDGVLPDENGIVLCAHFRDHADFAHTPIIFLSAVYREARFFRKLIVDLGVELLLHKPQDPANVARRAAELAGLQPRDNYEEKCSFDHALQEIRELYIESFIEQLERVEKLLGELERGAADPGLLLELYNIVHRIHGAAGSYGFTRVSFIAGKWEQVIKNYMELDNMSSMPGITDMENYYDAIKISFQAPDKAYD